MQELCVPLKELPKISLTTSLMGFDGTMQPQLHVSLVASYSSKFLRGTL
jgi:hypothetical protein